VQDAGGDRAERGNAAAASRRIACAGMSMRTIASTANPAAASAWRAAAASCSPWASSACSSAPASKAGCGHRLSGRRCTLSTSGAMRERSPA